MCTSRRDRFAARWLAPSVQLAPCSARTSLHLVGAVVQARDRLRATQGPAALPASVCAGIPAASNPYRNCAPAILFSHPPLQSSAPANEAGDDGRTLTS